MLGRVSLTLPASAAAVQIATDLACSFADQAGFTREDRLRIQTLFGLIIRFSVEQSYEGRGGGDVELELELEPAGVTIIACDWGKPMRQTGGADGPMPAGLEDTERLGRDTRLINLANDGKRIVVHVDAEHTTIVVANPPDTSPRADGGDRLIVRDAEPDDAERISNLLWRGYSLLIARPRSCWPAHRPRWPRRNSPLTCRRQIAVGWRSTCDRSSRRPIDRSSCRSATPRS